MKDLKIPVSVGLEGEAGYPHKGVIDFADNRVNPSTGTIQVRGMLAQHPAGSSTPACAPACASRSAIPTRSLMITERAIGTDQGRKFVYVVNDQNVVERRDVKLDRLVDGLQIIREG